MQSHFEKIENDILHMQPNQTQLKQKYHSYSIH